MKRSDSRPLLRLAAVLPIALGLAVLPVAAEEAVEDAGGETAEQPQEGPSCAERWAELCGSEGSLHGRKSCLNRNRAGFAPACLPGYGEALAREQRRQANLNRACVEERRTHCARIRGAGRVASCLLQNAEALSAGCRKALDLYTEAAPVP